MRKRGFIAFTVVLIGLQLGVAFAVNPDNGPGCGLGKLAWADYKTPKNIAPQVMMATTNGTFGSQTFGISFGTSGCTNDGKVMAEHQTNMFVASTFDTLSEDMARGGGEHLTALATLMGVPAEQHMAFFAMTQQHYHALVQAGETSSVAVVKALQDTMTGHPVLARVSGTR
ncbi:MAG: hypothetical protein OJF52_004230 [Nitrospira sp.]|jgi:hypothetical protein|nr:MAG: hypothetical protein OJF52_004230 [Nitrospira sp.]